MCVRACLGEKLKMLCHLSRYNVLVISIPSFCRGLTPDLWPLQFKPERSWFYREWWMTCGINSTPIFYFVFFLDFPTLCLFSSHSFSLPRRSPLWNFHLFFIINPLDFHVVSSDLWPEERVLFFHTSNPLWKIVIKKCFLVLKSKIYVISVLHVGYSLTFLFNEFIKV